MLQSVLIAGAGLGGLTVATALAQRGHRVTVYEQAPVLGEVGAGIQLSPNAVKALRFIGLEKAIQAVGFEPEFAGMRHYRSGKRYLQAPLKSLCRSRYGAPYIHIHRADLHNVLVEAARQAGVDIRLGQSVDGYEQDANGIALKVNGETTERADLLIGADGIRSAIRDQMLGAEKPEFTGQTAWRGVLRADQLPKGLIEPSATVWVGPAAHLVTYYLRGGELVNFVAVQERSQWRSESWSEPGNLDELRSVFGDWHPAASALINAVDETFLWALYGRKELPKWSDGRAVLLGDACHPTLPFMAQGAAMAMEDAVVLTQRVLNDPDTIAALSAYEAHRKPRATMLQERARSNASLFHLNGGVRELATRAKLNVASLLRGGAALKPLDPIYGYDPVAN